MKKNKMKYGFVVALPPNGICRLQKRRRKIVMAHLAVEYAMADASFGDVASIANEAYDGSLESYRP
ncbi:MAG: hypothetical protein IPO63_14430 [Bacteroidetes bacterium]|nr:hypothetical protein [Bacteroidota bacterium]